MPTLRTLLIQRAARLQERPAFTTPDWGTLDYFHFRNRVEGVALGIMATPPSDAGIFASTGTPWDWISEVAAACCGLRWNPEAPSMDEAILGGPRFNDEAGRQPYHDCEHDFDEATPFLPAMSQGGLVQRLQRLNGRLGWDHDTHLSLPLASLATAETRAALWSALYAGAHAELVQGPKAQASPDWASTPFLGFFSE
jgi:hypothetical protein